MSRDRDTSMYPSAAELRAWAQARQPGALSDRGMLPRFVIVAWDRSHPDRPFVQSESYHGTPDGYTARACRCSRCSEAGIGYQRATKAFRDEERNEDLADVLLGDGQ